MSSNLGSNQLDNLLVSSKTRGNQFWEKRASLKERKKGTKTICRKYDASCSWSNHLDRLRKVGGCIHTRDTHHSYWYAIWVQTSAMSINKAQGQSLNVAGINLGTHCFSHGQLYVAFSRVRTGKNLHVFAPDAKTKNIVYQTALQ
jgi:hypothetical protein